MRGRTIGVVGAGNMGSGIAQKIAMEGFDVVLADVDEAAARRGHERIRALLREGVERKLFPEKVAEEIAGRVHPTGDLARLSGAALVVEAVFEDLDVKRDLFRRLDQICPKETILATNTSSFTVADVAAATRSPERVVGLHYFYHPAKNRLLEVIAGAQTSAESFAEAWTFAESTGKTPIRCADAPGFVVNRYFVPWANEAVRCLSAGVADVATIEAAAKDAFRIGLGPFELMNVTGVPIALHAATTLGARLGPFYAPDARLAQQVASGKPWVVEGTPDPARFDAVRRRLLGATFLVAATLVEEGVGSIEDVDIGARVGLRWAEGPFELANRTGLREARAMAEAVAAPYGLKLPALLASREAPFEIRHVLLQITHGVAEITMNRPDALNALNDAVVEQLARAFDAADSRADVRTIVLRGSGKAFVAGADVKDFVKRIEAGRLDAIRAFTEKAQALFRRIDESPKLLVCRLDGLSLGGGSELALCCDVILATEKGSLGFPETGLGIYPGLGGTQRTPRRVGVPLARWLVLTGTMVGAQEAAAIGLVDEIVPREKMAGRIRELHAAGRAPARAPRPLSGDAAALAAFFASASVDALLRGEGPTEPPRVAKEAGRVKSKAPVATRIADELVRASETLPLAEGLAAELSHLEEVFRTKDAHEGLSSLGRRRPQFTGA
ncbi:MAG: 3-hydroxyacyl-CoA dehydrogenase NAD-binding domain-containing protein [bacterium]